MGSYLRAAAAALLLFSISLTGNAQDLRADFQNPPDSARPHTWWHWMNGNVSRVGITRELHELHRVGVRGVQLFTVSLVEKGPVDFMSREYRDLVRYAVSEAADLGMEVCLHNCAGWSSSGGPWVTPEQAMKMVVWTEQCLPEDAAGGVQLPQPHTRHGFYKDIAVLAFPTPEAERISMAAALESAVDGGQSIELGVLGDGDVNTFVTLNTRDDGTAVLDLHFKDVFKARQLTMVCGPTRFEQAELSASPHGETYHLAARFQPPSVADPAQWWASGTDWWTAVPFEPTGARHYRITFRGSPGQQSPMTISELRLNGGFRTADILGKAAWHPRGYPSNAVTGTAPEGTVVEPGAVIDISGHMDAQGLLQWNAPPGDWTVLRMGYTVTGKDNHPAPEEGRGLECDKLSRTAVKAHFDAMMGVLLDDVGDLAGTTLNNVLIDSYETGPQNWTDGFGEIFAQRRRYPVTPWLVALTGRVVASRQDTHRFLWDFRRTIADQWLDVYYRYFKELAHERGLLLSVEGYGNGVFDYLTSAGISDIPMSEFWIGSAGDPKRNKEAASAAHVYGKTWVGAEAFTSGANGWECDLFDLKQLGDPMFASGINRYIFHTYAHQPWPNRKPGMSMGVHGHQFNRNNTWWNQSPAWLDYVSRCQFLLQTGRFVGDILYFAGEGAATDFAHAIPQDPPHGYDYDGCDPPALLDLAEVRDGRIVFPSGASYAVLVMPDHNQMTPDLARKLESLVEWGATILGPRPVGSPSLEEQPAADLEVREIAAKLWGAEARVDAQGRMRGQQDFGEGTVYWGWPLAEVLAERGVAPDVRWDPEEARLAWLHRTSEDADIYFVCNQRRQAVALDVSFRVAGRPAQLWHPDTGEMEMAPVQHAAGGRTQVRLDLAPSGSVFVVFEHESISHGALAEFSWAGEEEAIPPPPELRIVSAAYGILGDEARSVDVTEHLSRHVVDGALSIVAGNQIAGDPAPLVIKELRVEYELDGKPHSLTVGENARLELPELPAAGLPPYLLHGNAAAAPMLTAFYPGAAEWRTATGKQGRTAIGPMPPAQPLAGPWQVYFERGLGAPIEARFDTLSSWSEHEEPGIRYFSGSATYVIEAEAPEAWFAPDAVVHLDLGAVANVAEVRVNGENLGVLWKAPFAVEVTRALRPGANVLEITVTNLWPNRMIGDRQPGASPAAQTTFNPYNEHTPLFESGLLGPVVLKPGVRVRLAGGE